MHKSPIARRWGRRWYAVDSAASPIREGASRYVLSVRFFLMPLFTVLYYTSRDSLWKLPARVTAAHSRDQSILISLYYPLQLRSVFHRRENASFILASRSSRISSRNAPSIVFVSPSIFVSRLQCVRRVRRVRSRERIDKNARSMSSTSDTANGACLIKKRASEKQMLLARRHELSRVAGTLRDPIRGSSQPRVTLVVGMHRSAWWPNTMRTDDSPIGYSRAHVGRKSRRLHDPTRDRSNVQLSQYHI